MLIPLNEKINELYKKYENEKKERLEGEKEINKNINDNVKDLNERLEKEKKIEMII